jgi:hypothetical protein
LKTENIGAKVFGVFTLRRTVSWKQYEEWKNPGTRQRD